MLSQNHSWNGLTRPARINDNLPPAAAGSPEQRCRVDSQPGTLAALRTRRGHERGVPGAARWVCGGLAGAGSDRGSGERGGRAVERGWGGSPARRRGEPAGPAASPPRALQAFVLRAAGTLWPGAAAPTGARRA